MIWKKVLFGLLILLMCLTMSFGYATLSSTLKVDGEVSATPPNTIYIMEIFDVSTSGASITTSPVNIGYPSTKVMSEIVFSERNSTVTFSVIIRNGTQIDQYFDILGSYSEMEGIEGSFSNTNVSSSVSIAQGTKIAAGEQKTVTVTFTYTSRTTNQTRRMLHEFRFVLDSNDLTQAVSKGVTDKFADILNGNLEDDITYTYNGNQITVSREEAYETMVQHMESDNSGSYIGNLKGADEDDKALLTALFEGALTFNVGDTEVPVTVMIKEKDVYGTGTKEMVLYITADDLRAVWSYVPVYAVVLTSNESGDWVQIGEIYAGEARTNDYSGWIGSGSFNTESWRSTEEYYGASSGSNIDTIMNRYEALNP